MSVDLWSNIIAIDPSISTHPSPVYSSVYGVPALWKKKTVNKHSTFTAFFFHIKSYIQMKDVWRWIDPWQLCRTIAPLLSQRYFNKNVTEKHSPRVVAMKNVNILYVQSCNHMTGNTGCLIFFMATPLGECFLSHFSLKKWVMKRTGMYGRLQCNAFSLDY